MARQNLFLGGLVTGIAGKLIGGMFGGGGEGGGQGDGGKSSAIRDFMANEERQSDRFVDASAAIRQRSQDEQDRTAEELAAKAFEEDQQLKNATKKQFAEKWQPIQDTLASG